MSFLSKSDMQVIALLFVAVFLAPGCSEEGPTIPEISATPDYENIWPAAVGNQWEFELFNKIYVSEERPYDSLDDIPELRTMEELYADLQGEDWGEHTSVARGVFNLVFAEGASNSEGTSMLLSNSREDIEGKPFPPSPLWLGDVWLQKSERISYSVFGWMSWLHLQGDLSPGNEFSYEVPAMVESHLYNRIWEIRPSTVLGKKYRNCLEVFYLFDMGIQTIRDENNEVEGYYNQYGYGVVVYAPEVGPVFFQERIMMSPGLWEHRKATLMAFESGGN